MVTVSHPGLVGLCPGGASLNFFANLSARFFYDTGETPLQIPSALDGHIFFRRDNVREFIQLPLS